MGISGDVYLACKPAIRVEDVFVIPSVRRKSLTVRSWLINESGKEVNVALVQSVFGDREKVKRFPARPIVLPAGGTVKVESTLAWEKPRLWGYGPYGSAFLYRLVSDLGQGSENVDHHVVPFGFREFWAEGTKLMFNGKPIFLLGDSDAVTMAMPGSFNRQYVNQSLLLRRRANVNAIRLGWEPHLPVWFEVADEAGMLLEVNVGNALPEGPGAGVVEDNIRRYVRAYRNHPSIILWESNNEAGAQGALAPSAWDLLGKIHRMCKEEDPSAWSIPRAARTSGSARNTASIIPPISGTSIPTESR